MFRYRKLDRRIPKTVDRMISAPPTVAVVVVTATATLFGRGISTRTLHTVAH